MDDGKLEKLWNVENSGESYYWNDVEFPDADFMTELERKYKSYNVGVSVLILKIIHISIELFRSFQPKVLGYIS